MLENIALKRILFFDIETAPLQANYYELNNTMRELWDMRIAHFKPEAVANDEYYDQKAGVYAEFSKVICISMGFFTKSSEDGGWIFRVKSFYGHDEVEILENVFALFSKYFSNFYLCGHNIKTFDVPFLCRRAIINGIRVPDLLNINSRKPWEIPFIDTMHLWKFGDYRNYTSLHLLTTVLNVPSPKEDMTGSDVAHVYWEEQDLERIKRYCEQDVLAIARVVLRFKSLPLMELDRIIFA